MSMPYSTLILDVPELESVLDAREGARPEPPVDLDEADIRFEDEGGSEHEYRACLPNPYPTYVPR
jgi:hypothetical protein